MREFYRSRGPELIPVALDLNALIEQVLELTRARWSDMAQQRGIVITIVRDLRPGLPGIGGAAGEIRDALTNLVFNAVDAMPDGGTLRVRTAATGSHVCLEVADTGIGMDEETSRRCLEPFFTTKNDRGTGLGLAMVYGMVQRHAADIHIGSVPGEGTQIRLTFPILRAATPAPPKVEQTVVNAAGLHVLLIDDDSSVLKAMSAMLEAEGLRVSAANDPRQGLERFHTARLGEPFAVVVTDLGMPHLDGRGVAAAVKSVSPATPVILLTGWGQRLDTDGVVPAHVNRVLGKPPKLRELREALAQCCP